MKSILISMSVLMSAPLLSAADAVHAPAHGSFDWKTLKGTYRFGACSSTPAPIWSDRPNETHVTLIDYSDWTVQPPNETLEASRMNDGTTVIAPGWSLEHINQGRQSKPDGDGRIYSVHETYTTADGIFGSLAWEQPHNTGWSTFQVFVDAKGQVSYEMKRRFYPDPVYTERCALIRQP